jgi:uncharacterized membrane protein YdjX (TVP38/TMEM64 family)
VADRLYEFAQSWESLGLAGLGLLALVFALGSLTFMPRFAFYSISGLVFGLAAIPAVIIGSTLGATLAFLLARGVLRGAFQRLVDRRPRWRATLAAVDAEGWRIVALTRLASPLPGGAINYLYGLTGIPFVHYMLATAAGLAAPISLFAGLGALGRIALKEHPLGQAAAFATGLVVLAIAVLLVVRRRRASLTAPP